MDSEVFYWRGKSVAHRLDHIERNGGETPAGNECDEFVGTCGDTDLNYSMPEVGVSDISRGTRSDALNAGVKICPKCE